MTPSCGMLPGVREGMCVGSLSFLGAHRKKKSYDALQRSIAVKVQQCHLLLCI